MIFELHNAAYLIILLVATNPARFTLAAIWRRVKVALVSWLAIAPSHAAGRKATVFSAIVGRANIGDWTFFIESYRGRDAVVDEISFVTSWNSKEQISTNWQRNGISMTRCWPENHVLLCSGFLTKNKRKIRLPTAAAVWYEKNQDSVYFCAVSVSL